MPKDNLLSIGKVKNDTQPIKTHVWNSMIRHKGMKHKDHAGDKFSPIDPDIASKEMKEEEKKKKLIGIKK